MLDQKTKIMNYITKYQWRKLTNREICKGANVSPNTLKKYVKILIEEKLLFYNENTKHYSTNGIEKNKPPKRGVYTYNPNRDKPMDINNGIPEEISMAISIMDKVLIDAGTVGYSLRYYEKAYQQLYQRFVESDLELDIPISVIIPGDDDYTHQGLITLIDRDSSLMIQIVKSPKTNTDDNYYFRDLLYKEGVDEGLDYLLMMGINNMYANPLLIFCHKLEKVDTPQTTNLLYHNKRRILCI